MAPGAAQFYVHEAGDPRFNGGYYAAGERGGKTCFRKLDGDGEVVHFIGDTAWAMSVGLSTTCYRSADICAERPSMTGWRVLSSGAAPAPTIHYPTIKEQQEAERIAIAAAMAEAAEERRKEEEAKAERKRLAEEAERKRLADEAEAERQRLAAEAEARRLAEEAAAAEAARLKKIADDKARIAADHNHRATMHRTARSKNAQKFAQTAMATTGFNPTGMSTTGM
jgi:hypothetical protein